MKLEAQRKDKERQEEEEAIEELKRFMTQEMAKGFSLFREALLVLRDRTQREVHEGCNSHSVNRCYCVIYGEKKRSTTQTWLDCFSKRVNKTESSKEPEPMPSVSGMSGIAACPLLPIPDHTSVLPSTTSSSSWLFTQCQPLYAKYYSFQGTVLWD